MVVEVMAVVAWLMAVVVVAAAAAAAMDLVVTAVVGVVRAVVGLAVVVAAGSVLPLALVCPGDVSGGVAGGEAPRAGTRGVWFSVLV